MTLPLACKAQKPGGGTSVKTLYFIIGDNCSQKNLNLATKHIPSERGKKCKANGGTFVNIGGRLLVDRDIF
jgi:hypothetical protein